MGAIEQYIGLRLSPDGHEVLVTIRDAASGDLWRVDLTSGARSRVTSEGRGWYAVWSPDGQQVAMNTRGGGEVENLSTFDVQVYPSIGRSTVSTWPTRQTARALPTTSGCWP